MTRYAAGSAVDHDERRRDYGWKLPDTNPLTNMGGGHAKSASRKARDPAPPNTRREIGVHIPRPAKYCCPGRFSCHIGRGLIRHKYNERRRGNVTDG